MEENDTVVEDEVDTGELLHHLETNTKKCAADVAGTNGDLSGEAAGPGLDITSLRNDRQLILVVGNDFCELLLNVGRISWLSTDIGEGLHGFLNSALLDEVTWRIWEEEKTNTEDESPEKLNSNWDTV